MGYNCAVDGKHYTGKPVKVVVKQRKVQFHHDSGVSDGLETVKEISVHPDNVAGLGEPVIAEAVKHVEDRSKKVRRYTERPRREPEDESHLETWKEYQEEKKAKKEH